MRFKHFIILSLILIWVMVPMIALAEAEDKEPVTITYWTDPRFKDMKGMEDKTQNPGDYEKILAKKFEEKHPHVNIEIQALAWEDLTTKVTTAIRAGNPPDILKDYLGRTSQYAFQGLLEPLDKYISEEELDNYEESYLDMYTLGGHLHALPSFAWAQHLLINTKIWEEKGESDLLPEGHNWTFEEFDKAIRAVAEPGELWPVALTAYGDGQGDYRYLGYMQGMGGNVYSDDFKEIVINNEKNIEGLEYLAQLEEDELIIPGFTSVGMSDYRQLFFTKQTAVIGGNLAFYNFKEIAREEGNLKEPFEIKVMNYPHAEGVTNGMYIGPTGFAVFEQEDDYKRKWVIEFTKWLNNKENMEEYVLNSGQFPARNDIDNPLKDDEAYVAVQQLITDRGANPDLGLTVPSAAEIKSTYGPIIQQVIQGSISAEEGVERIEKQCNRILEKGWERLPEDIWAK